MESSGIAPVNSKSAMADRYIRMRDPRGRPDIMAAAGVCHSRTALSGNLVFFPGGHGPTPEGGQAFHDRLEGLQCHGMDHDTPDGENDAEGIECL